MKKCLLFAPLFALLFTGLFVSSSASAASPWDNVVRTTDELEISMRRPFPGTPCEPLSLSTDYMSYFMNDPGGEYFMDAWTDRPEDATWLIINDDFDFNMFLFYGDPEYKPDQYSLGEPSFMPTKNVPMYAGRISFDSNCDVYATSSGVMPSTGGGIGQWITPNSPPIFLSTAPFELPPGYEGEEIPDTWSPPGEKELLKPDYSWQISKSGQFKISYLNNLPHFLTGISWVVIEKMNENWDGLDQHLTSITVNPAGWLKEEYELPGAGYYMIRIDHNQQLDSPPWGQDDQDRFRIDQVWIQFYWDGRSFKQGTTVGCTSSICNDDRSENNPINNIFGSLDNIETFGLTAFLTAPITFFQQLPSMVANCSPISFPLMGQTVTLQCLAPRYWAWSSSVMTIVTTVFTAVTAYWVGFNIFRNIKNINNPNKDQIEVAKL